jgi:hypothetical protein
MQFFKMLVSLYSFQKEWMNCIEKYVCDEIIESSPTVKLNAMRLVQQRPYEEQKRRLRLEQEKAKKVRVRVR